MQRLLKVFDYVSACKGEKEENLHAVGKIRRRRAWFPIVSLFGTLYAIVVESNIIIT